MNSCMKSGKIVCLFWALFMFSAGVPGLYASIDAGGTEFWIMFNRNHSPEAEQRLLITAERETSGIIEVPGMGYSMNFNVVPGTTAVIDLPADVCVYTDDGTESKGIHIVSENDIVVYGVNKMDYSTDGFLALPAESLGTEYFNMSYFSHTSVDGSPEYRGSMLGIAAAYDNTTVTIIPSENTGTRPAGVPYTVTLNRGDAYQLMDADFNDLTGTHISSDRPVAVFGGHKCTRVPFNIAACDHLVEQLNPVDSWGTEFVTVPFAEKTGGDTFRIMAAQDNTSVVINGAAAAVINRGEIYETTLDRASYITSGKPVSVMQYANSMFYDDSTGDPFMAIVYPSSGYSTDYNTAVFDLGHEGMSAYINIAVPSEAVDDVTINGAPVAASFYPVPGSDFHYAQINVAPGESSYILSCPEPFGAMIYGYFDFESYGYPVGGFTPAPVPQNAVLDIKKSVLSGSGSSITYGITVNNISDFPAYNLSIWDTLPAEIVFSGGNSDPEPVIEGNYIRWDLTGRTLESGSTIYLEFTADITVPEGANRPPVENTARCDYNDPVYEAPLRHPPISSNTVFFPLDSPVIYPNPFDPGQGDLKIANLIPGAEFQVYTVSGEFVYSLQAQDIVEHWNAVNRYGLPVSAGIYYYIIKNPDNSIHRGKFFVVRGEG
ncbi:MAG: T9SS type A sorting domain-containing protein [Candidatus Goldiibacteriota bacterium]